MLSLRIRLELIGVVVLEFIILMMVVNLCFGAPIDLQIGARPQAMGGAFVAVADDISATYWNPAGLTQLKTMELALMRLEPFDVDEVNIDFAAFGRSVGRWGLGVSFLHRGAELEEGRGVDYKKSDMEENDFVISLAFLATKGISIGCNMKRLTLKSKEEVGGAGTGYDLAILYKQKSLMGKTKDLNFGLMIRNSSCDLKDESVAPSYRLGIATDVFAPYGFQAAVDLEKKREVNKKENDYQWHIGLEARPHYNLAIRLGNDNGDWTYGLGFYLKNWKLDYAFQKEEGFDLGNSNRLSLIMKF